MQNGAELEIDVRTRFLSQPRKIWMNVVEEDLYRIGVQERSEVVEDPRKFEM